MNRDWTGKLQVILLSAERNCTRTLSNPLWKKHSWCILRKWRQNTWKKMCERVFFVNLQAGISQLHYIKCLKSTCEIVSYCIWWLKFEISCSLKEVFWKTSQNSQINTEQSSGGVQSKDVLKNLVKFTGKHLLFNKVAGWKP